MFERGTRWITRTGVALPPVGMALLELAPGDATEATIRGGGPRGKRIALMALVVVMCGTLARRAGADNCKANHVACKMNQQCCSGLCAAGLCAAQGTTTTTSSSSTTTSITTASTTTTTLPTVCGTGTVLVGNECQPDYGAICGTGTQLLNGQCVPEATCPPSSCGDGVVDFDAGEGCDDGNVITETECPYGFGTCTGCKADCSAEILLTGPFCGDGATTCPEACDDGNTNACGTCSSDCSTVQAASATGFILAVGGASLEDGETFTIDDGTGTVATFEFDLASDGVGGGNTPIDVSSVNTASSVATKIQNAINASTLQVDATATGNLISLVNQRQTSLGNQAITETVNDAEFHVAGMSGGAGGDCLTGVGCSSDSDCASGACSAGTHTCE